MDVKTDFVNLAVLGLTILTCLVTHHAVSHALWKVDGSLASRKTLAWCEKEPRRWQFHSHWVLTTRSTHHELCGWQCRLFFLWQVAVARVFIIWSELLIYDCLWTTRWSTLCEVILCCHVTDLFTHLNELGGSLSKLSELWALCHLSLHLCLSLHIHLGGLRPINLGFKNASWAKLSLSSIA